MGRGLTVAALVTAVSIAFHTAANGCPTHLTHPGFLLLAAGTAVVSVLLSTREWTFARLLAVVGVAQMAFHYVLDAVDPLNAPVSLIGANHVAEDHGHSGFVMLVAHAAAVVTIATILRRGERWLLAFVDFLASLLPQPAHRLATPISPLPPLAVRAPKESGLRRILFASLLTRRGPPAYWAAIAAK